jgi:hypothetical protein
MSIVKAGKSFLNSAINVNKLIVPQLNHLLPNNKQSYQSKDSTDIKLDYKTYRKTDNKMVYMIKINADIDYVKPTIYSCAIDMSGSMSEPCTNGDIECEKFSKLDLVKHSLKTIVYCARPEDKIVLTGFNSIPIELSDVLNMDEMGKRELLNIIESMSAGGGTNIIDALNVSLKRVKDYDGVENNIFTMVLSDGNDNSVLPRNEVNYSKLNTTITTFGYGYDDSIDSKMLANISSNGNGSFVHIPDHSICGSAFVNYISNCYSTSLNIYDIHTNGKTILYDQPKILMGGLQSGYGKKLIVSVEDNKDCEIYINGKGYILKPSNNSSSISVSTSVNNSKVNDPLNIMNENIGLMFELAKFMINNELYKSLESKYLATDPMIEIKKYTDELLKLLQISSLCQFNNNTTVLNDDNKILIEKLLLNIKSNDAHNGQIEKALSNQKWLKKWGYHYIRMFLSAHRTQMALNFKDSSYDEYKGTRFNEIIKEVESIYKTIPAPTPSLSNTPFNGNFQASFYNPQGPCFDGNSVVTLENGNPEFVKNIRKGDKVMNSRGNVMEIKYVIKTKIPNKKIVANIINDMIITPYHPVYLNGVWNFPANLKEPAEVECEEIYDFVVDDHHIVTINNVDVITLGHGFTHDKILKHKLFGTSKIIEHLEKVDYNGDRYIVVNSYNPSYIVDEDGNKVIDDIAIDVERN